MSGDPDDSASMWAVLSTPPIVLPLSLTFCCFLITTIITAVEISNSTPRRLSSSSIRQTPSPHTYPSGTSARGRGTAGPHGTQATGAFGNTAGAKGNSLADSPESLEEGSYNIPRSNSGKALRTSGRNKMGGVSSSTNYGSVSRGSNTAANHSTSSNDDVGGGSSGDNTRSLFYNLLFLALLSRMVLIPAEALFLGTSRDPNDSECMFVRTLPDLVFASAFSLLVLFYAQLAGTASGGGPRGLSLILLRPGYFRNGNIIVYVGYFVLLFLTVLYPGSLSQHIFQSVVWLVLSVLYFVLLALLAYFGPVLVSLLRPSLDKRSGLAIRLIAMCIICSLIFLSRGISFASAVIHDDIRFTHGSIPIHLVKIDTESDPDVFLQDCVGYVLLEIIPSLAILFMMHQKRRSFANSNDDTVMNGSRYQAITQQQGSGMDGNSRRMQIPSKQSTDLATTSPLGNEKLHGEKVSLVQNMVNES